MQERYGFHVSHLNIAKTKRKCGIIERQNYNLPNTGYEYDGQKYHDVTYLGEYEDDDMPRSNTDYIDRLLNKRK